MVLSAGTLGSARIALTSGLQFHNPLVGKGLTDHEAWAMRCVLKRSEESSDDFKEPMLLQSMISIAGRRCLMSVTYNSDFFLGGSRRYSDNSERERMPITNKDADFGTLTDTVAVFFEFHAELDDENEVLNLPSPHPVIRIKRSGSQVNERFQIEMQELCTKIRDATLNLQIDRRDCEPPPRPSLLGIGVFSHEVGTMRMDGPKGKGVVDDDLKVHGFENLYVCDLSVFPVCQPANPTRTLAALCLRLAKHLVSMHAAEQGHELNGF